MLLTYSTLVIAALVTSQQAGAPTAFVDQRTGIVIQTRPDLNNLPGEGSSTPRRIRLLQDSGAVKKSIEAIQTAMSKYDANFLRQNIKTIYVFRKFHLHGANYGGTAFQGNLYLSVGGAGSRISTFSVEETFHHEFAHALTDRDTLTKAKMQVEWEKFNPEGFAYLGHGVQGLKLGYSGRSKPDLHPHGFWSQYSTSSFDEDFAVIVQNLFMGDSSFWKAVRQYPRLAAKTEMVIRFYNGLDPNYTPDWFMSVAQSRADTQRQRSRTNKKEEKENK